MKKHLLILVIALLSLSGEAFSQYEDESYDDVTSDKNYFIIGYLNTIQSYPKRFEIENKSQKGIQIGSRYNHRTLEDIDMGKFAKARLNIGGGFTLGFTYGNDTMNLPYRSGNDTTTLYSNFKLKTYTVVADLFTFNVNFEYFIILPGKRSVELSFAVSGINLGGTLTYFDAKGTSLDKKVAYTLNFLPLYIEPSAKIRFRGATLGIGFQLNPYSFLEYRGGTKGFYSSEEEGLKFNSASPKKYSVNVYLNF